MTLRLVLGLLLPLAGGLAVAWLLGTGTVTGAEATSALLTVGLEVLGGGIGGFLLRSWSAGVLVPLAVVVGVAFADLIRMGAVVQGSQSVIVPLATVALLVLLVPTALGAVIGVALGKRSAQKVAGS